MSVILILCAFPVRSQLHHYLKRREDHGGEVVPLGTTVQMEDDQQFSVIFKMADARRTVGLKFRFSKYTRLNKSSFLVTFLNRISVFGNPAGKRAQ